MQLRFIKTHAIQFQIGAALLALFVVLAAIVITSLDFLGARKHDYIILNLTGQMRVISEVMLRQSQNYVDNTAQGNSLEARDLQFYRQDIYQGINHYDEIVTSLESRTLVADLVGGNHDEHIVCTWDKQSRGQMGQTAAHWHIFKSGLLKALGPDNEAPNLAAAARFIVKQGPALVNSSNRLAVAFQEMMEGKLAEVKHLNQFGLAAALLTAIIVVLLIYRRAFRPLNNTIRGFNRVALGDLDYRLQVDRTDEIGQLRGAFNNLTQRLSSYSKLTQRITQAENIDTTLRFVYEEFRPLLPLDWVGFLRHSIDGQSLMLDRFYGSEGGELSEGQNFPRDGFTDLLTVAEGPMLVDRQHNHNSPLLTALQQQGLQSILFLPLQSQANTGPVLVFAANQANAYTPQHLEILDNISLQIGISLDKTQGMESLVVSAVEGLAKLAESRDPETGDHLTRMSLYSVVIAETMMDRDNAEGELDHQYIRDLFRFAPMHDIGKVGIEDRILLKPGRLDDAEREEMQRHPTIGAEVLRRCEQQVQASGHSIFRVGIEIAHSHHEKYDGSGYPQGLAGEAIPLSARIVAAADVFDALTSRRPYKEAWPIDKALTFMQEESGRHFDPRVVKALNGAMPRILEIYERHKHV